jgi:succinate dehydrogenase/fumarate reductase flavoprotein subunit
LSEQQSTGSRYDLVVAGFGLAGAAAALTAQEAGARVLVVEKDRRARGISSRM